MGTLLTKLVLPWPVIATLATACLAQPSINSSPGNLITVDPRQIVQPLPQGLPVVTPFVAQMGQADNKTLPPISKKTLDAPLAGSAASQPGSVQSAGCASGSSQPPPLVTLASALKCDADLIFEYVYNNIEFEPLYGSNKGALGTLLDRKGDDADQVILFVTLLNVAGYSQTGYQIVALSLTGPQIANWLGVQNDAAAIVRLLNGSGIPYINAVTNPDGSLASIQVYHFMAALQLSGTWYYFDPSFKFHTILTGIPNLATSVLGYDRSQFLQETGGTIDGISISNINRAKLRSDLVAYATNLVNYVNLHDRTLSVGSVIGGKLIVPLLGSPIRVQIAGLVPLSTFPTFCPFQNQPNVECRTFVRITMPGASSSQAIKLYTDEVYGHRITIFSIPTGSTLFFPTLLIDGTVPSCVASGSCTNIGPTTASGQLWSILSEVAQPNLVPAGSCQPDVVGCKVLSITAGGSYLVNTSIGAVGRGMAEYHRQLLAQARARGATDNSEPVLGESLASIGYGYGAEESATYGIIDQLANVTTARDFEIGIVGQTNIQQSGFQGPYVDFPLTRYQTTPKNNSGATTTVGQFAYPTAFISAGFAAAFSGSVFESAILEQTQAPVAGMTAASTVKLIDSNMDPSFPGQLGKTFFADGTTAAGQSTYTNTIIPAIQANYFKPDLDKISAAVAGGNQVLIPANGKLNIAHWTGGGYFGVLPIDGAIAYTSLISGGMSGGFSATNVTDPAQNTQVTLAPAANSDTAAPLLNTNPSPLNPQIAEPIDGVTGAYIYEHDDIVTGSGSFPYALRFSRTYLSSSGSFLTTTTADTGIGNGWAHNWSSNVKVQSDPYLGIGTANSPAVSAATSIVALYVTQDLMSVTPTAQNLTLASMVSRWFADQLASNAAMVTQPNTTEEFIALPRTDGSTGIAYNAPPGSSARLNQASAGQFSYMRADGIISNFGPSPAGGLQSIVFPNGVTINLTYSGSPLQLSRISNNLGRSIALTYTGAHVSAVADDTGRSTSYAYDARGNLASFTDPVGAATTYSYDTTGVFDSLGHLTQIFYPSFPTNAFLTNWYDPLGRVVQQGNAIGGISRFCFAGSRTEQIDPYQNRHITYQTDRGRILKDAAVLSSSFGNVFGDTVQQNGLVNITTNRYDGLDRLMETFFPEAGAVAYTYATNVNPWANNIQTVIQWSKPGPADALRRDFEYDAAYNKPTKITDTLGLVSALSYEPSTGNMISTVADSGSAAHFNATSRFTYNSVGLPISAIDPMGSVTQFSYDGFGNQTSVVRDAGVGHLNQLTSFGYNAQGDIVSITDPRGNTTTNTYDAARRPITTTAPNGLVTTYTYDPDGHIVRTQQTANGIVLRATNATYTLTGKPATTSDANGNMTNFTYDTLDRLATLKDADGRVTRYAYDTLSRQISISNLAVQSSPLVQKSYTPDGLLAGITDANNHTTSFAYDTFDRLATTTYPLGSTESLIYDADSNILLRKTRSGQNIGFAYDTLNRVKTKSPPSPATAVNYSYDLNNRLTSVSDSSAAITAAVPPSGPSVQFGMGYSYDAMNRPTAVNWNPAPAAAAPAAGSVTFGHSYNKVNQRTGQTVTDNTWFNYPVATPSTVSYSANVLNQYTAVGAVTTTYDGNGNLTSDGTFTLGYDAENRLTSASGAGNTASYTYDAQGRRKSRTLNGKSTVFVTDASNREVLEYDGSSGTIQRWYAYGLGSNDVLNQMNVTAATRDTFVPDILGSVIGSQASSSGALSKTGYLPYGKSMNPPATFAYTAQSIDPEIGGLYYYRARYYSPAWGRFLQADPIGYRGGVNLYAYVGNDPLNLIDPTGLTSDNPSYGYGYGANAMRAADNWSAGNYRAFAYYEFLHTAETAIAITPFGAAENVFAKGATGVATEVETAAIASGGRLGSAATRAQNSSIATDLESRGNTIFGGGGKLPEEYIPGAGPGTRGSTYVDISAINNSTGAVTRVQTIDTLANGAPTAREAAAAGRIQSAFPNDTLLLIPKQ